MNPFVSQLASKETIELMARFFDSASKSVKRSKYDSEILEAFDLIQAISCFRYFPTVDECVKAFPNLTTDRNKVEFIWEQFGKLTQEQLSDVYISSLYKLELTNEVTD